MKRFIGGIIIIAMLSQPGYLAYGAVALEIDRNSREGIVFLLNSEHQLIREYINEIENTSDELCLLIEEKNRLLAVLEHNMSQNAKNKKRMSALQVKGYKNFCNYNEKSNTKVRSLLFEIEDLKKLTTAKRELLKEDTDYNLVINDLSLLHSKQEAVISILKEVIQRCDTVLDLL